MTEIKYKSLEKENFNSRNIDKNVVLSELNTKLKSLEIKKNINYPKPIVALEYRSSELGEFKPIGTLDNISLVIGKAKAKKSFFIGMVVATAISKNYLHGKFRSNLPVNKKDVLYFDTEQSSYHVQLALNRICEQANNELPETLHVYGLRSESPQERLDIIKFAIYNNPNIGFVVIDGIKDLVNSINDEVEASKIANYLLKWSEERNIHIVTVLHQNKGDNNPRGHIGTELTNKAETVLTVTVDSKNKNISIVEPQQCRNIPFDPLAFQISEKGMPELVEDYVKSSSRKEKIDIINEDNDKKQILIKKAFGERMTLTYTELKSEIKKAHKLVYHTNFADNKIKDFITHCREIQLLKQDKEKQPYYINSLF